MTVVSAPDCLYCKHLSRDSRNDISLYGKAARIKCEAFKDGVPYEILTGEHDHTKPYKGDNGIQFEAIKE